MKNLHHFNLLTLLCFSFFMLIGAGCSNEASTNQLSPEEKLNSLLNITEGNAKTFSQTNVFVKMVSTDSLVMKMVTDGAMLKIDSYGKVALTEKCLEGKAPKADANKESLKQFKYDSTYLSLINLKIKEIETNLVANGDPTILDLYIRNEKLRALITQMNNVCATEDKGEMN